MNQPTQPQPTQPQPYGPPQPNQPQQYPPQPQQWGPPPPGYMLVPINQAPQPVQPQAVQPVGRAVTQGQMPYSLSIFHWTMIFMTCGLWTPVYLSARRKRRQVTRFR